MLADNHKDNVENVEIKYVIYNRIEKKFRLFMKVSIYIKQEAIV